MRKETYMATRIKQTWLILVLHEKRNSHVCILVDFPALPLTRGFLGSGLGDGANVEVGTLRLQHLYHCGFFKPNRLFSLGVLVGWTDRKVLKTFGNSLQIVSQFLISHHSVTLLNTGLAAEPSMAIYQTWEILSINMGWESYISSVKFISNANEQSMSSSGVVNRSNWLKRQRSSSKILGRDCASPLK